MSVFNVVRGIFKKRKTKLNKMPTVKCNIRKFLTEKDVINELATIKEKYSNFIYSDKDMAESILSGFNLKKASDSMMSLNKGRTRAELSPPILWLSSRCHYLHNSRRAVSAGITIAEWACVDGFCDGRGNKPSHHQLHGKKFNLKDGLKHKGKTYQPGVEEGCLCFYRPILPF